jgi:DNA-binding transcriptional MerR regulator
MGEGARMKIGDLAQRTAVSRRLLRYYEEQGLLRPMRLPNGYRDYDESHVTAVRQIRLLLEAGLPTAIIARLLHCVHEEDERVVPVACPGVIAQLQQEWSRLAEEIARLRSSQDALARMLRAEGTE